MVESLNEEDSLCLKNRSKGLYYWPVILHQLVQKIPDRMCKFTVFSFKEDHVDKKELPYSDNQVIIGNLSVISFLFELYLHNKYSDINEEFPTILNKIIHYVQSDLRIEMLMQILQKSLFKLNWPKTKIKDLNLNLFQLTESKMNGCEFYNCQFVSTDFRGTTIRGRKDNYTFINCLFDKTFFGETNLINVSFSKCMFKHLLGYNLFEQKKSHFSKCIFENCELFDFNYQGSKFTQCIFYSSSFFRTDKLEKLPDNQFDNCLLNDQDKWYLITDKIWRPVDMNKFK
ncbi:hypothetical protein MHK_002127 [Candidatus Magnetomorum sp. HK-1]|nr:hypothetical protein MHK_002127 [Candidatus Magnetomorum sp. HK-1]